MKKRFKILTIPQEYDLDTQAQIVCALAVVHNFMKTNDPDDPLWTETLELDSETDDTVTAQRAGTRGERARAAAHREAIALAMWEDYQSKRSHA
jgi:hypothetical protein